MRSKGAIGVVILLILIGLGGCYGCATNNALIASEEAVSQAWADVENQYQRRSDLVPQLVRSVEAAADLERDLVVAVTRSLEDARSFAGSDPSQPEEVAAFMRAQEKFASNLTNLTTAAGQDPSLQSVEAYRDLLVQLEGTENRIAVARRRHNQSVSEFNRLVRTFPRSLFARMLGFEPKPGFTSDRTSG
jgi:LemA protein